MSNSPLTTNVASMLDANTSEAKPAVVEVGSLSMVGTVASWEDIEKENSEPEILSPKYYIGNDELDPEAEFEEVASVAIGADGKPIQFTAE